MNVAYFSTATAIGSCNSYSRFTISGGLLMIDMSLLPFFFLYGLTQHGQNTWAGATATVSVATKWGRSSPFGCFARVQMNRRVMCNLYAPNNFASPRG